MIQAGARELLRTVIQAEVSGFMTAHTHLLDEEGRQRLVRHGFLPEREVMTGIGTVPVQVLRVRDRARTWTSEWQARSGAGGPCTNIKAIGKMAGQGAHSGRPRQRKACSLFTSGCCYTLQSRHEGKIRAADINREMQEAGDHSRHAKADRYGQRTAPRSAEMGRISSLTNADTRQIAVRSPAGQ